MRRLTPRENAVDAGLCDQAFVEGELSPPGAQEGAQSLGVHVRLGDPLGLVVASPLDKDEWSTVTALLLAVQDRLDDIALDTVAVRDRQGSCVDLGAGSSRAGPLLSAVETLLAHGKSNVSARDSEELVAWEGALEWSAVFVAQVVVG